MSLEAGYTNFSTILPSIYDAALVAARDMSIMANLVAFKDGHDGLQPRILAKYSGGTAATVTESTDMAAQQLSGVASGTLTPAIIGTEYFLNDTLLDSDDINNVAIDAGTDLGNVIAEKVDTDLAGLFSSFTGGTVGTAGGTLTWTNIMRAAAYLRAQLAPFPYFCVLRPEQWYYLASASSGVPTLMQSPEFMNNINQQFFVGNYGGIGFYVDANITSGTAAAAGMFSRQAIAYDERRPFRIETQRDASRAAGGIELVASIVYAKGVWRPTFGCYMIGTSS